MFSRKTVAIYNTTDMCAIYADCFYQKLAESVQCQTRNISQGRQQNAVHQKCEHALLYILGETSQHQQSFH